MNFINKNPSDVYYEPAFAFVSMKTRYSTKGIMVGQSAVKSLFGLTR